jgi:hypothetical protein
MATANKFNQVAVYLEICLAGDSLFHLPEVTISEVNNPVATGT